MTPRNAGTELAATFAGKATPTALKAPAKGVKRAQAPAAAAPVTETPIVTPPAGTLTDWSRSSGAYLTFFGYVMGTADKGSVVQTVETAEGDVYVTNPLSQFPLDTWLKATKEADGSLTIAGGQAIYVEEYDGETTVFYAVPLEIVEDENGAWLYPTADNVFTLRWDGTGYASADPAITLGICAYQDGEYAWTGFGDYDWTMMPVTDKVTEIPDGLVPEKWAFISEEAAYFTNVAIAGDKIYISDLAPYSPGAWTVGTIKDGVVEIPAGSFLGADETLHWAYIYGGTVEQVYDEEWEEWVGVFVPKGAFRFNYDADAKRLSSIDTMIVTYGTVDLDDENADVLVGKAIYDFLIEYQVRDVTVLPANPYDLYYTPYNYDYGYADLMFYTPLLDRDGKLMDIDNLYYEIYVDGELYTFYPDEYIYLDEEMTLIPNAFAENYDFGASGAAHQVYFYMDGIDTIGVQSIYIDPTDKKEYRSDLVELSDLSVANIAAGNAAVASSTYYDLQGRKVANPGAGLYIRRDVLTDGTVNAVKVVK